MVQLHLRGDLAADLTANLWGVREEPLFGPRRRLHRGVGLNTMHTELNAYSTVVPLHTKLHAYSTVMPLHTELL